MIIGGLQGLWVMRNSVDLVLTPIGLYFVFFLLNVVAGVSLLKWQRRAILFAVVLLAFQLIRVEGPRLSYALAYASISLTVLSLFLVKRAWYCS